MNEEIIDNFANAQHEIWSHWMKYLFTQGWEQPDGTFKIKSIQVEKWKKQMTTSFVELSEEEKESDRNVIKEFLQDSILKLVEQAVSASLDNLEKDFVLIDKENWNDIQKSLEVISETEIGDIIDNKT